MSLLFLSRCVLGIFLVAFAGYGAYTFEVLFLGVAGCILVIMSILFGIQLAENGGCRCAVCTTPLFQASRSQSGNISPRARPFIGSRRIYRSLSVLSGGFYHCNHCGEKVCCRGTQLEIQELPHNPQVTRMRSLPARRAS